MTAALGIDCGGTATRWLLVDDAGKDIGSGAGPGATGLVYAAAARDHTRAVLSGISAEVIAQPAKPGAVIAGVTGLTSASKEAILVQDWLAADLSISADQVSVVDDMWIAFHTVFEPGTGIVVYSGTGSVCSHIDANGVLRKSGAHGHIVDDGGSGYWIGRQALHWLVRTWDEQGPPPATPLAEQLYRRIGGPDWELIRAFVYKEPRTQVSQLAQAVAGAADSKDATALRILADAGAELARLANVLAHHVGPQPIALVGGTTRLHPALRQSFIQHLDRWRIANTDGGEPDLREAFRTPVEAAAHLALAWAQAR